MAEAADASGIGGPVDAERAALLAVLVRHDVDLVLIGGAAIQSHGGRYDTMDIDLAPEVGEANLQRLCDALNELDCRLVTDPADMAQWVPLPTGYFTPRGIVGARLESRATPRPARRDLRPVRVPDGLRGVDQACRAPPGRRDGDHGARRRTRGCARSKREADRPKDHAYFRTLGDQGGT